MIEGESSAEIEAPIERVWKLVEDVERGPEWQGGLQSLKGIERDGEQRVLLAAVEVDAKVRALQTQVRFAYEEPTRLSWVQEKGQLKSIVGSWELARLDDARTRVTYRVSVDLGRLGLLLRGPILAVLRQELAGARADELKRAVESGG
jgi:carbon monoxide dehydrogenase subunit G